MRVLHVPYGYLPDPAGGTEIYVSGLAAEQAALGLDVAVAAPAAESRRYEHAGIPVWRFGGSAQLTLRELYGEGDPAAARAFARVLDDFAPETVHLHAMTSAISVRLAEEIRGRRIPIVFNYHTPTVSCGRGTLLRWGTEICDGSLETQTCAACVLTAKGLPQMPARAMASLPEAIGRACSSFAGGAATALRMRELTAVRIGAFRRMMDLADRVLALCNWTRDLLVSNGVPQGKITLCRQGIVWDKRPAAGIPPGPPVRLAFLGRLDATKGVRVVVEALRRDPALPVQLDVYGVSQGETGRRYAAELKGLIGGDARIRLLPPVAPGEAVATLAGYHGLVAPSQWLETGPLVVLEAFAAGIPVIGSDLGGIAELVTAGVDGLLVRSYSAADAWLTAMRRVVSGPELLDRLRAGIRPPRHAREVASEVTDLYSGIRRLIP